jgi:hypothetical protein
MSGPNTSASGGYLSPTTTPIPENLTFSQFLQTVMVGISGINGTLVRPLWQPDPPKMPDAFTNWLAFGITKSAAKGFPFQGLATVGDSQVYNSSYHSKVNIACVLYGPLAFENFELIRDGFYLPQNNESLKAANFGLIGVNEGVRNAELIDEIWFNRFDFSIDLYYQTLRTYPILTFLSANGTAFIPLTTNPNFNLSWLVPAEEE